MCEPQRYATACFNPHRQSNYFNYLPTPKLQTLNYLLFVVYLIVLCWLLLRIPFIKNAGINNKVVLGLFLIKVLAGIAIGWVSLHIYGPGNDYWDVNDYAREEYRLLLTEPAKYFSNLFVSDYTDGFSGIFNSYNSYWNDLETNIIIKLISVFNILSRGDYYINSLFFNFIIFFGHVILYRLFSKIYPGINILVIIGCFLLPSTLYFVSGIHKDGMVFLLLAIIIYSVYQSLAKHSFNVKRVLLICISLFFLFLIRNVVMLLLLPALFAWILSAKTKWSAWICFGTVYLFSTLLFFGLGSFTKIDPMQIVIKKQADYMELKGAATQIELTPLKPNFKSFIANAPQALFHSVLRPAPGEQPLKSLLPFSLELFLYLFLVLMLVFFRNKDLPADKGFLFFILFFCFTIFLIIGYIVPNLGSLIRYRSLYLPLIITPVLCSLNWKRWQEG